MSGVERVEIFSEITHQLKSVENSSGRIIYLSGYGGNGKTMILKGIARESDDDLNISTIIDLNNPYFWNIGNILNEMCLQDFIKINFDHNRKHHFLNEMRKKLSNSQKKSVFLFDTAESIRDRSKSTVFFNIIKDLPNTILVVAGRPDAEIFSDRYYVKENDEKNSPTIKIDIKGFSNGEALNILKGTSLTISQKENLMCCCLVGEHISPLYLTLMLEKLDTQDASVLIDLLDYDYDPKKIEHFRGRFIKMLIRAYLNQNNSNGTLALWLSIIRYPISYNLWKELAESLGYNVSELGKCWNNINSEKFIRSTPDSGITLHDELASQAAFRNIYSASYSDNEKIKNEIISVILTAAKKMNPADLIESERVLISSLSVILNPKVELERVINEIKSLIETEPSLAEVMILNILDLLGNDVDNRKTALTINGFTKDIRSEFIKDSTLVLSVLGILGELNKQKIIEYFVIEAFYNDFVGVFNNNPKNLADFHQLVTYSAVSSGVLEKATEEKLLKTIKLYKLLNDQNNISEVYGVLGYFYRLSADYTKARECYIYALKEFFGSNLESRPSSLPSVIKNLAVLDAYTVKGHHGLFLIGRAKKFTELLNKYDSKNHSELNFQIASANSIVAGCLHNYSESEFFINEAFQYATKKSQVILLQLKNLRIKYFRERENDAEKESTSIFDQINELEMNAWSDRVDLLPEILNFKGKVYIDKAKNGYLKDAEYSFREAIRISRMNGNYEQILANVVSLSSLYILRYEKNNSIDYAEIFNLINDLEKDDSAQSIRSYYYQLMLHKAHWLMLEYLTNENHLSYASAKEIYLKYTLKILRGQSGSAGAFGTPAGYFYWSKVMRIVFNNNKNIYFILINDLLKSFSHSDDNTFVDNVDYRAALVTIPLSFKSNISDSTSHEEENLYEAMQVQSQLEHALSLYKVGHWIEARKYCIECICHSRTSHTLKERGHATLLLGYLDVISGNLHDALTFSKFGIDNIVTVHENGKLSNDEVSEFYRLRAEIYRYTHNYTEAWKNYSFAHTLCDESSFNYVHILQEMAICSYFAYLEGDTLYTSKGVDVLCKDDLLVKSKELITQSMFLIDGSNKEMLQKLRPMALLRKAIIQSSESKFPKLTDLRESLAFGWYLNNQKSVLLSSILIMDHHLKKWISTSNVSDLDESAVECYRIDKNLDISFVYSEYISNDSNKKIINDYPSLKDQFIFSYHVLKLVRGYSRNKNIQNDLHAFVDVLIETTPNIFGSALSTLDRTGVPLGYKGWVRALSKLGVENVTKIIDNFHYRWDYGDQDQSESVLAFLLEVSYRAK